MKYILMIIAILLMVSPVCAATYYMRADGTAANKAAASGPCGTQANCMSIATHDADTFSAGDIIKLCDDGGTFRDQMDIPSSGSAGSSIIYIAETGDDPLITAMDLIAPGSSWEAINNKMSVDGDTVALYDFSNTLDDTSANSRNLAPTGTPDYTTGPFDFTLNDPSTNAYASYPDAASGDANAFDFGAGTSFTIEAFIRSTGNANEMMITKGNSGQVRYELYLQDAGGGVAKLKGYAYDGGTEFEVLGTTNLVDGEWHHVAGVWDLANEVDNNLSIFVDGVEEGTAVSLVGTGGWDNAFDFTIGAHSNGANKYDGEFEQVKVSDVAVTSFPVATGENVWMSELGTTTNVVSFNDTMGTEVASQAALTSSLEWYYDSPDSLFVYSTTDPDTAYTSPGIEMGQRGYAILLTNKDYVTVDGLTLTGGNIVDNGTLQFNTASSGTNVGYTIQNCTFKNGAGDGILITSYPNIGTLTDSTFNNNTISYFPRFGISLYQVNASSGNENTISDNDVSYIDLAGIEMRGNYIIAEGNTVHDGGLITNVGGAIHLYSGSIGEGTGDNNIIRYNLTYSWRGHLNDGYGISIDQWCDNNDTYYNIVYDVDGPGIYLYDAADCKIENNIVYNACVDTAGDGLERGAIRLTSSTAPNNLTDNAVIKNNIAYTLDASAYSVFVDGDTVGNTVDITNNDWYRTSADWYRWDGTPGATLATWNALDAGIGTDINSDPLFTDTASLDFTLQSGSPCIDTGTDVDLTQDYLGNTVPWGDGVDMGAYELQYTLSDISRKYKLLDLI